MSERIVPTRFGLKYSPKPVIAIEYHRAAPDSGLATMKVTIEKLKPATHDVQGVVDALQKKYPRHLGSDVVNILQLKRLVTHLLVDGRPNLPEAYLSLPEPTFDEPPEPPLQKARRGKKPLSISEILGLSSGPTPAPTPEAPRLTHAQLDAAVHGSGSHRPAGGTDRLDGAGAGAASAEGKRYVEGRSLAAEGRSVAAEQRQLAPEERSVATFSAALEKVRLSSPEEIFPPPPQQRNNTSDDAEQRKEETKKRDFSRKLEKYLLEGFPRGDAARSDLRDTTTTMDETQGPSMKIEKTVAVAEDDDDGCNDEDGRSEEGRGMDDFDGEGTIDRALPTPAGGTLDADATVDEATGRGRSESRQKNDGSGKEEEEQEEEQDKKRREEKGAEEDKEEGEEEEEEEEEEEKDEVTEMLEILDDTESAEGEGVDTLEASVEQKEVEVGTGETADEPARGEDRNTTPYVSNTAAAAAAAAEDAAIATTTPGRVGNVSGTPDTLRQRTEVLEVASQVENDDNAHKSSLQMEQSILPSATRGTIGRTEDEMIADIEIPVPEDQAAAATPSASSSSPPLPTPLAAILAPPRSLSPPSSLLETGTSSASSLSASSLGASALGGGLPLPPVGGGRPRFGLLGSLPPVGGRGLPSLSLRSGAGLGEEAKTVDSISVAASAFPGANRSGDLSAPPPPPPPPLGVFGSSKGGAEESLPSDGTPISRVAPRAFTGSAGSTRSSSILGDAPSGSRDGGVAREGLGADGSESQGGDEEGTTSEASAKLPASPRQHQGQEEEAAGVGIGATVGAPGSGRGTAAAGGGEKAQGEGGAGDRETSGGGYFSGSGGEISEEEIPEEVSSDDDISFEQDSSDGRGGGTGEGGNDDYFS